MHTDCVNANISDARVCERTAGNLIAALQQLQSRWDWGNTGQQCGSEGVELFVIGWQQRWKTAWRPCGRRRRTSRGSFSGCTRQISFQGTRGQHSQEVSARRCENGANHTGFLHIQQKTRWTIGTTKNCCTCVFLQHGTFSMSTCTVACILDTRGHSSVYVCVHQEPAKNLAGIKNQQQES